MVGNKCIIVIEDEVTVRQSLTDHLIRQRFDVFSYDNAEEALSSGLISLSDAVIMDIGLPGVSGLEATTRIKQNNPEVPVLMLTAYTDLSDRITGLENGADDYIIKPFFMEELIARLRTVLRRYALLPRMVLSYEIGDLFIDVRAKKILRQNKLISLSSTEFHLLIVLAEENGHPVSKEFLLNKIWKGRYRVTENTVEVYINFLRNKIDKPFAFNLIHTRPGFGYYLSATK